MDLTGTNVDMLGNGSFTYINYISFFVFQLQHHLSVCVFIVLVCSGVVILLYEPEIFLSLPFQHQFSAFLVGWQVALNEPLERLRYRKKQPFFD